MPWRGQSGATTIGLSCAIAATATSLLADGLCDTEAGPANKDERWCAMPQDRATIILFSGDMDKAMAAFTIADGAAGMGMDVSMFFTFWGVSLLRKQVGGGKLLLERMFKRMMPVGPGSLGLSKMNFGGIGAGLMRRLMRQRDSATLPQLMQMAMDRKIEFIACEASLKIIGIEPEELIDYERLRVGGVDAFLETARGAAVNLFI